VHAFSQQKPSTQVKPVAHAPPVPHAAPIVPASAELSGCWLGELSTRGELSTGWV
jgi:hypothetical protein